MLLLSVLALITLIISIIVMTVSSTLAKKTISDREKNSPFECGFDPNGSARLPFSLRFFLIAVIFLIFDVEITLLLPLACSISLSNIEVPLFIGLYFFFILLMGLYHEWDQGALDWPH